MQTREAATLSYFSRTPEGPLLSVSVNILDGSSWVLHRQIHAIEKEASKEASIAKKQKQQADRERLKK